MTPLGSVIAKDQKYFTSQIFKSIWVIKKLHSNPCPEGAKQKKAGHRPVRGENSTQTP